MLFAKDWSKEKVNVVCLQIYPVTEWWVHQGKKTDDRRVPMYEPVGAML